MHLCVHDSEISCVPGSIACMIVLFCAWIIPARSLGLGSISIGWKPRERSQRCHNGGCSGREKCDERTQSCQCGNQGGGWLERNTTNKATETTVRGEIGANEAIEPPIRRRIGANEAMRSPGAGRRERSHLGHDCVGDDSRQSAV
jgi:hypothetical protein